MTATRPVETVADRPPPSEQHPKFGPLLPDRLRRTGRPNLLVELVFTVGLYLAYSRTRRYVPSHRSAALHRAREIWHAERLLHVNFELTLNHAVDKVSWLVVSMNYYYATLHFIVTPLVLIWLYAFRPDHYRAGRTALYCATLLALIGFAFFALAPPRFLPDEGFIDTVVTHHTWGSWGSGHVSTVSNLYAAMPSVHIVWAAWSGLTVAFLARHTWIRVIGALYPLATLTVILSTGNHFLADAVGGAVTLSLGFLIQRLLFGRPAYRDRRPEIAPRPDALPSRPAENPAA
ncbi:phosphatase PAP2 family protein [Streptomyces sp. NBC_01190]|uniref:phosphatase PAP2 family protein n=1 Tax=Streptomyces sp. NBC_01190 TaxID=2903767 RepID=UPI00386FFA2B|nr:phosphatase PAP2 family protein [Streptomyces sp. NBC_01190]